MDQNEWALRYNSHTGASDAPSGTLGGWCTDFWDPEYTGNNPNENVNDYNVNQYVTGVSGNTQYLSSIANLFNSGTTWTIKFMIEVRCYGGMFGNIEEYQFWIDNVRIKCDYEYNSAPTATTPSGPTSLLVGQTGTYSITGTDPDNDYIQLQVDFDADGSHQYSQWSSLVPSGSTGTIDYYWNYPGTYLIKARARDEHGLTGDWSNGLTVTVTSTNQDPNVDITYPTNGQTVSGTITVLGTSSDSDGYVTLVEIKIDSSSWQSCSGTTSWSKSWDTTGVGNGQHTISARSKDDEGAYSEIDSVTVNVQNGGNQNPVVDITYPNSGQTVSGTITISGTASDTDGSISLVEIKIDSGSWQTCSGTNSWTKSWDTNSVSNGQHTISARSKDNNGAFSNIDSVTVNVNNDGVNNPPDIPSINGPTRAKVRRPYDYTFIATDPDEDDVYICIKWGDRSAEEIVGPYKSGETVLVSHRWSLIGNYQISAQTMDTNLAESDWTEPFTVKIRWLKASSPYISIETILKRIIDRFPILDKILCQIH